MAVQPDPQSLSARIEQLLRDKKALRPVTLHIADRTTIADYFVIAAGRSARHSKSLYDHLARALKKDGARPRRVEGTNAALWILIDYGPVVVHIFTKEVRERYNLERLWGEAGKPN